MCEGRRLRRHAGPLGLTCFHSVQHGEGVARGQRRHMKVAHGGLLRRQRRQLVEVGGEQAEAADGGGDVFADGPGQAEAVVGGRAAAQLVDDDQRVGRGRAAGARERYGEREIWRERQIEGGDRGRQRERERDKDRWIEIKIERQTDRYI